MGWKYAQLSDCHLGHRLSDMDKSLADVIGNAVRTSLRAGMQLAHEKGCSVLLVPGNVFDVKGHNPDEQLQFFYDLVKSYPAMDVIVAPGNADAYGGNNPYCFSRLPVNLHLFTKKHWEVLEIKGVSITGRAFIMGEGIPRMNWAEVPRPPRDRPSILMLHGTLEGVDDGLDHTRPINPFLQEDLYKCEYSYIALGHMMVQAELKHLNSEKALAAYAGPPQCFGWAEGGPGGILIGDLDRYGADLEFHRVANINWISKQIEFPEPYVDGYEAQLKRALAELEISLKPQDMLRLKLRGEMPVSMKPQLENRLDAIKAGVERLIEPDVSELAFFSGIDPLNLPKDSLLYAFLHRCTDLERSSRKEQDVVRLVRRLGWQLFTGQGMPLEITE
jgi:DNA repair exonuclease SbcCD nuclease subunit